MQNSARRENSERRDALVPPTKNPEKTSYSVDKIF
jgi:hypothetical protein